MPITPYIKYKKEGYVNADDPGRLSPWGQYRAANSKSVEGDERDHHISSQTSLSDVL